MKNKYAYVFVGTDVDNNVIVKHFLTDFKFTRTEMTFYKSITECTDLLRTTLEEVADIDFYELHHFHVARIQGEKLRTITLKELHETIARSTV